jgi:DNA-directed RNA polymerase subunit RPC12/RpoP
VAEEVAAEAEPVRYRCTLCGNLTRFDVIERKRARSFYHYTLGGMLSVDEEEILEQEIEEVRCRWCNSSSSVEEVPALYVEETT